MDFKKLKIGYVPYLPDLSQPGDRRRFPYFAKRNNVPFEIADKNKESDLKVSNSYILNIICYRAILRIYFKYIICSVICIL